MRQRRLVYLSGAPRVSTHPEAEASGPRAHVLGVIDAFREDGWNVEPYIVGDHVPKEWVRASERKVNSVYIKRVAIDLVRLSMGKWHALQAWKQLGSKCDWVYERLGSFQSMGTPFHRNGIPWVVETNAPLFYEAKAERNSIALVNLARKRELQVYESADVVVTVTEALKSIIVDFSGISADKVLVVPNGVDTSRFDPGVTTTKRVFDCPTIGFVGSLISWQALDLLIDCIAELNREGIRWHATIVGDGPMRDVWQQHATLSGVDQQVVFTGRMPWRDIPSLIAGFDVCYCGQVALQVGQMYLSPLKLYEYMAMAKPVIASAFEDTGRVVKHGETGFLFSSGEKKALKDALRQAWLARPSWLKIGEQARELIVHQHSWHQRIKFMVPAIDRILQRQGHGA